MTRKQHPQQEESGILYDIHLVEEAIIDIDELIILFVWGTVSLIYNLFFTLAARVLLCLIIAYILMFAYDLVFYGAVAVQYIVQGFIDFVQAVIYVVKKVASGISDVASGVEGLFGHHSSESFSFPSPSVSSIVGPWLQTLLDLESTCRALDTWQAVLGAFGRIFFSVHSCPILRISSLVPFIIAVLDPLLSWSSNPYLPIPSQNCQGASTDEKVCMYLRLYLVILYLIIPLLVIECFIVSYWPFIKKVLKIAWPILRFLARKFIKLL